MLVLLSPAKTLDMAPTVTPPFHSEPRALAHAKTLIEILRKYSSEDLMTLMDVSKQIASLNAQRYRAFATPFTTKNATCALLCFKGDVYTEMDVAHYTEADFRFAQAHLRILSGLYGVLRPLDLMQAYRLEMGTKLANAHGKDLYAFWGEHVTEWLNEDARSNEIDTVVNLASQEYFQVVQPKKLHTRVITPSFKEYKNGSYQVVGLFAKRARGAMADYIIKHKIQTPEPLKQCTVLGYEYEQALSSEKEWVFVR